MSAFPVGRSLAAGCLSTALLRADSSAGTALAGGELSAGARAEAPPAAAVFVSGAFSAFSLAEDVLAADATGGTSPAGDKTPPGALLEADGSTDVSLGCVSIEAGADAPLAVKGLDALSTG